MPSKPSTKSSIKSSTERSAERSTNRSTKSPSIPKPSSARRGKADCPQAQRPAKAQGDGPFSSDYATWLQALKKRCTPACRCHASEEDLIALYHSIGSDILKLGERGERGVGSKRVIERLARDLNGDYPGMLSLTSSNLKFMRFFAEQCPDGRFGQQSAAQLPWLHIVTLLARAKPHDRERYASEALAQRWSQQELERHIDGHPREGQGKENTLLAPLESQSDPASMGPYASEALALLEEARKREVKHQMMGRLTQYLLQMQSGFAFMGRDFSLDVGGDSFFIDLLFYHVHLERHVVIQIKACEFKPEHIGELNFFLNAVDGEIKSSGDKPTIGLLLCKDFNRLIARYTLEGFSKPIGVAQFGELRGLCDLPDRLADKLPSIESFESLWADLP